MSRFSGGWVKLHRGVLDRDLVQNINLFALWNYLLLIANYKESQIIWCGKQRILKPGECVLSVKDLADQWGISKKTISKWLEYLRDSARIGLERSPHGTVVTICNWSKYQITEDEEVSPSRHQVATKVSRGYHEVTHNEEVQNGKEEKEINLKREKVEIFDQQSEAEEQEQNNLESVKVYLSDMRRKLGLVPSLPQESKENLTSLGSSLGILDQASKHPSTKYDRKTHSKWLEDTAGRKPIDEWYEEKYGMKV